MEDFEKIIDNESTFDNVLQEQESTALMDNAIVSGGTVLGAICKTRDSCPPVVCCETLSSDIICSTGDAVVLTGYSWMFVWAIWCSGSTKEGIGNNPVAGAYPLTTKLMCTPNSGSTPILWRDSATRAAFQLQPNRQTVLNATYFWRSGYTLSTSQTDITLTGIRSASTVTASIYASGHTTKHGQFIRVVRYCVNTNTTTFTKYAPVTLFGSVANSTYSSWATKIRLPQGHYRFVALSAESGQRIPCAEIGFYSPVALNTGQLKYFVAKTGGQMGEVILVTSATTPSNNPAYVSVHRPSSFSLFNDSSKFFYFSSGGTYYLYIYPTANSHLLRLTDIMEYDDAYWQGYTKWDYGLSDSKYRVDIYDGNNGQADDFYGLDSDIYGYYGIDPQSLNDPMCIPSTFYSHCWLTPDYFLNQDTGINVFGNTQLQRAVIQTSKGYRVRGMVIDDESGSYPLANACVVTQGISGKTDETGWFDFYVPSYGGYVTVYGPDSYYYPASYNNLYQMPSVISLVPAP